MRIKFFKTSLLSVLTALLTMSHLYGQHTTRRILVEVSCGLGSGNTQEASSFFGLNISSQNIALGRFSADAEIACSTRNYADFLEFDISDFPLTLSYSGYDSDYIPGGNPNCNQRSTSYYTSTDFNNQILSSGGVCAGYYTLYPFYLSEPLGSNNLAVCDNLSYNLQRISKYSYRKAGTTDWVYFPAFFKNGDLFSFSPSNIPALETYSGILDIRGESSPIVNYGQGCAFNQPPSYTVYTNTVTYNIIPCSPQIVDSPVLNQNLCSDSNNGSATFTFSRDLSDGEYFNMTYYQLLPNGSTALVSSEKVIKSQFTNRQFALQNLGEGTYYLRYQTFLNSPTNPTSDADSAPFTIIAPSKLVFTIPPPAQILCKDAATGSITVNATGGKTPYKYSLNNTTWQDINVFDGLPAGNYTVYVKDANGCTPPDGAQTVAVAEPLTRVAISNPVLINPVLSNKNTGSIAIDITGGKFPYSYSWTYNNPNGNTNTVIATNEDINTLYAGTYTIVVTDANGCSTTATYTLVDPPVLVPTITVDQVIKCFGTSTGMLSANASGGRPGYSYQWFKNGSFLSSNQQITNLNAGDYRLVVTDQDGLGGSQEVFYTLTQPSSSVKGSFSAANSTCFGANNGSITITASGGTPFENMSQTYSYYWTKDGNALTKTTASINNLSPGNYGCTVTDQNGCTTTINNIVIEEPPVIEILFSNVTSLLDASNPTGAISVTAAGGSGTFNYLWSNGATTSSISGLFAGTYTVTVTDAANSNCKLISPFTVTAPPVFTINVQQNNLINCFGNATASLEVFSNGGTKGVFPNEYSYSWTGANIPLTEPTDNAVLLNLPAGTYTVQVQDANTVVRTKSFTITSPDLLTASYSKTNITCSG